MEPKSQRSPSSQAGFTLVELMVGMAIGMLVALVIVQVMSTFEAQKRATTGSADAQTNGGIALYTIGREMQMAGYPLLPTASPALLCTTLTLDGTADNTTDGLVNNTRPLSHISPVTITDGGTAAGASDTITLRYGDSAMGGTPTQIYVPPAASAATAAPAMDVGVAGSSGCIAGDKFLIINQSVCTMSTVVAVPNTTTITFADASAAATAVTAAAAGGGLNLACLGTWNELTYAVSNGNLQVNGADSVAGIVDIQAQYGISASTDSNQIAQWVDASAATGWDAPIVSAVKNAAYNRNRIKAIRIAVVARNPKMEPTAVTTACSSTTATAPTGLCAWEGSSTSPAPSINLSNTTNWDHYRYRVFETVIPLRNVIWAKSSL